MSSRSTKDTGDEVCKLYIEQLSDDQLTEEYYCRACGHLKDEHARK
jgi:hypothetical protein